VSQVHIRTLARAAQIVGGPQELALKLNVTPSHLALWMSGAEPCPPNVFLHAVDLVLERAGQAPVKPAPPPPPGDASDKPQNL
jgi:DNA-binding transcriptional regulator YdaS (Cro superfamily)